MLAEARYRRQTREIERLVGMFLDRAQDLDDAPEPGVPYVTTACRVSHPAGAGGERTPSFSAATTASNRTIRSSSALSGETQSCTRSIAAKRGACRFDAGSIGRLSGLFRRDHAIEAMSSKASSRALNEMQRSPALCSCPHS